MNLRLIITPSLLLIAAAFFTCSAEEDPSYEPFDRVKPPPPPKRAVSLSESPTPTPAPKAAEPVVKAPKNVYVPPPVERDIRPTNAYSTVPETPYTRPTVTTPAGPKVKYILNGKPVYEGDPDPIAEAKAAEARAKELAARNIPAPKYERPLPPSSPPVSIPRSAYETPSANVEAPATVRLDFSKMGPPTVSAPNYPLTGASAYAAPATPSGPKVKYILNGRPVYEGDPDPVAEEKNRGSNPYGDFSAKAVLNAPPQTPPSAYAPPANSAALLDDLTADKPNAKNGAARSANEPLVLEDMPAPGPVGSRAKKCYAALAELKKNVESISRSMDNRGKENAQMIHSSEVVLSTINDLAAIWPNSEAFMDICTSAKRSALIFNSELTTVPWTWTRVRWSHESMVQDVKKLRSFAKLQAEAEPRPQPVVMKDGSVVYMDAQEANIDPLAARREAAAKAARDELARIKENAAMREERKNGRLTTDLDGNSKAP